MAIPIAGAPARQREDVLSHLPAAAIREYTRGEIVYGPRFDSDRMYLVISGKVGLSHTAGNGSEVLLDVLRPDDLFGEPALLGGARFDQARALERTKLMSWLSSELEALIVERPRLGLALVQVMAQRNLDLTNRIQCFSQDCTERRLARSLIRFGERLGQRQDDGGVRMMAFTHAMLGQHVGASREIVTHCMTRFRRQGHISYSRADGILLHSGAFQSMLGGVVCASSQSAIA